MSDRSMVEMVQESAPTFKVWLSRQEFEYRRVESQVIDYLNSTIDYDKVEDSFTEESEIDGWGEYFGEYGIEKGSDRAAAAKKHIRAYVKERSQ